MQTQYDDGTQVWDVCMPDPTKEVNIYTCILKQCCSAYTWEYLMYPLERCPDGVYRKVPNHTLRDIEAWANLLSASPDRVYAPMQGSCPR